MAGTENASSASARRLPVRVVASVPAMDVDGKQSGRRHDAAAWRACAGLGGSIDLLLAEWFLHLPALPWQVATTVARQVAALLLGGASARRMERLFEGDTTLRRFADVVVDAAGGPA